VADDATKPVQYETRTVQTIRGTESRSISKWEGDGWELVSQTTGRLRTELVFRRPRPKTPWRLFAILGGVLVVLAIVIVIGVNLSGGEDAAPEPTASSGESAASPSPEPSEETAPSTPAEEETLTIENSEALAALLAGPADGATVATFAEEHAGQLIEFDGSIVAMNNHDGYDTRYDILIANGDYSETHSNGGPNFQFRDVNTVSDLHYVGDVPDAIGVGDNVHVVVRVGDYEENTSLFLLEPVATQFR